MTELSKLFGIVLLIGGIIFIYDCYIFLSLDILLGVSEVLLDLDLRSFWSKMLRRFLLNSLLLSEYFIEVLSQT